MCAGHGETAGGRRGVGAEPLLPQRKVDADLGRVKSAEERNAFLRFGSRVSHWAAQHGAVTERMRAFQRVEGLTSGDKPEQ